MLSFLRTIVCRLRTPTTPHTFNQSCHHSKFLLASAMRLSKSGGSPVRHLRFHRWLMGLGPSFSPLATDAHPCLVISNRNATNPAEEEVKQETPAIPEKAEEPKERGFGEEGKEGEGKSRFQRGYGSARSCLGFVSHVGAWKRARNPDASCSTLRAGACLPTQTRGN